MDDIDAVLARLAAVSAPRSLADDPGFVARLDASATRGELFGTMRATAFGIVAAALMVAMHPAAAGGNDGGFLLVTPRGDLL